MKKLSAVIALVLLVSSARGNTGVEVDNSPDFNDLYRDKVVKALMTKGWDTTLTPAALAYDTELSCESLDRVGTSYVKDAVGGTEAYPTKDVFTTGVAAFLKYTVTSLEGLTYSNTCFKSAGKWKWGCSKSKKKGKCQDRWAKVGLDKKFFAKMRKVVKQIRKAAQKAGISLT